MTPPLSMTTSLLSLLTAVLLASCSTTYYAAMEKAGIHKRDIMVDRVAEARSSQEQAQEQFKSALEQFASVVHLRETDLKKAYDRLNGEYEACVAIADKVSSRIDSIESVAEALFDEWEAEIGLYQNREMARSSRAQLQATQRNYRDMLARMKRAERSMDPVLVIFRDNVLFLKHNLNAQAIGSLRQEFGTLQTQIDELLARMNEAIESSDAFIAGMQQNQ